MSKAQELLTQLLERDVGSVYSKAVSLGYTYIRGGKPDKTGKVWLTRFTKSGDPDSPAIFVGYDEETGEFVVEEE